MDNKQNARDTITVLVASCDKYADLWEPFSVLWKRYWPDCPFEIVLVTESPAGLSGKLCFSRVVACGKEPRWGTRVAMALETIKTPYVLMLCDDYFLCDNIDNTLLLSLAEKAGKFHIGYLPMIPAAEGRPVFPQDSSLAVYEKGHAYCIGTQAGIWDHRFLDFLAKQNYGSIWEFERNGSFMANESDFLLAGTRQLAFPFEDAVHKGCWELAGVRLCQRNHIALDFSRRKPITDWQMAKEHLKGAILQLNPTLVVKLQNLLHLGKR